MLAALFRAVATKSPLAPAGWAVRSAISALARHVPAVHVPCASGVSVEGGVIVVVAAIVKKATSASPDPVVVTEGAVIVLTCVVVTRPLLTSTGFVVFTPRYAPMTPAAAWALLSDHV